jgi:excisionase family DNA binding protein
MDMSGVVPKFFTVEEVAELLRVSPRSIYDWVSQGVIPFHKAGRRTIFLLEEIVEWTAPHGASHNSAKHE